MRRQRTPSEEVWPEPGKKRCYICKEVKPVSEYHGNRRLKGGYSSRCKDCNREYIRDYQRQQTAKNQGSPDRHYESRYSAVFLRLWEAQNGRCRLCGHEGNVGVGRPGLHVDHDPETGQVRSLLCSKCNQRVGAVEGKLDLYRSILRYIDTAGKEPGTLDR